MDETLLEDYVEARMFFKTSAQRSNRKSLHLLAQEANSVESMAFQNRVMFREQDRKVEHLSKHD